MSRVLMFSIALNGYDIYFGKCLDTQRAYAKKQDYVFEVVTQTGQEAGAKETAWLKLPLMRAALDGGYDKVFWIDADCEVKAKAPPLESLDEAGKSFWIARGNSGRFNSGVMIVQNDERGRVLLDRIIASAGEVMPEEDRTAYENGHVIHFAKDDAAVAELDGRWNNNRDIAMDDYIRHYTAWPMRHHYRPTWAGAVWRKWNAIKKRLGGSQSGFGADRAGDALRPADVKLLKKLTEGCLERYPALRGGVK